MTEATQPNPTSLAIGEHLVCIANLLNEISLSSTTGITSTACQEVAAILRAVASNVANGNAEAVIHDQVFGIDLLHQAEISGAGVRGTFRGGTESEPTSVAAAGRALQDACHGASAAAGWWQDLATGHDYLAEVRACTRFGKALVVEKLALIHSEVSEALEGVRKNRRDDHLPDRPSVEVELADAVIRIGDLCGALQLDLGGAIEEKMAFNRVRPDHQLAARAAANGKAF